MDVKCFMPPFVFQGGAMAGHVACLSSMTLGKVNICYVLVLHLSGLFLPQSLGPLSLDIESILYFDRLKINLSCIYFDCETVVAHCLIIISTATLGI